VLPKGSQQNHIRSILAHLLTSKINLPILVCEQVADCLYNGQFTRYDNFKPNTFSVFYSHQASDKQFRNNMSLQEVDLHTKAIGGLTNAKINKLVEQTITVARDIYGLLTQLLNAFGILKFCFLETRSSSSSTRPKSF